MSHADEGADPTAKLRILIATNHYGAHIRELPLAAALAEAYAGLGHHVQVVATSWSSPAGAAPQRYQEPSGVNVLFMTPRMISSLGPLVKRITKWIATPLASHFAARKALKGERYDLLIGFTPAVASAGPFLWGLNQARRSFLWIPDFFPYHHRLLGYIPGGLVFRAALAAERTLFRRFDVIGCWAPAAVSYLRAHYKLRPTQTTAWIPIWGATDAPDDIDAAGMRARYGLPRDKTIIIFGGQIELGRGIEDILATAALARDSQPDLFFLFVGGGTLTPLVRARVDQGADNVGLIATIPRDEYLAVVAACDIGIVATVADLNIPAFPSKTWDYLRAGLPVAASVELPEMEDEADYSQFVAQRGFGRAVQAGDPKGFLACIEAIVDDPQGMERMRRAGRLTLDEVHDVGKNALRILEATGLASSGATPSLQHGAIDDRSTDLSRRHEQLKGVEAEQPPDRG